jgi:hypothetical protein
MKSPEQDHKAAAQSPAAPPSGYEIRALVPAEFPLWEEFAKRSPQATLFHSPLWLKAANVPFKLFGCFRGTELRGGLATGIFAEHAADRPHPALTPYLGILFPEGSAKYVTTISTNKEIARAFAVFLKREFHSVEMRFPPEVTDLQPFIWEGFRAGVRYTYRLPLADLRGVLDNMDSGRRRNIRSAEKDGVTVCTDVPFAQVMALSEKTFRRQGLTADFREAAFGLNAELETAGRCRSFLARNRAGFALSAVWIVWDNKRAYYLIGGYDEATNSSNAGALAIWRAMEFTARELKLREFDFEGSMVPAIERFFRKFGGTLMPTYTLSYQKHSLMYRAARKVARWARLKALFR